MTYALRFLPEVAGDAIAASGWYEDKSPDLGNDFLREFYSAAERIQQNPLFYRTVHTGTRRCLLDRFPYSIYFTIEGETVLVVGLFHCARDPRYISGELRNRDRP